MFLRIYWIIFFFNHLLKVDLPQWRKIILNSLGMKSRLHWKVIFYYLLFLLPFVYSSHEFYKKSILIVGSTQNENKSPGGSYANVAQICHCLRVFGLWCMSYCDFDTDNLTHNNIFWNLKLVLQIDSPFIFRRHYWAPEVILKNWAFSILS